MKAGASVSASRYGSVMDHLPSQSVDVLGGDVRDAERGRARARLLFLAAFVFAALAWIGTLVTAIKSSETNGIYASWIAIFPTTFGGGGLLALNVGAPGLRALGVAFGAGVVGVAGLWLFFEGIWPSL